MHALLFYPDPSIANGERMTESRPPNPIILFNNHFIGFRRNYPESTRMKIASHLGYDGYEFRAIPPADEDAWREAAEVFAASGMRHSRLYVIVNHLASDSVLDAELTRMKGTIERMAKHRLAAHVTFTIRSAVPDLSTIKLPPLDIMPTVFHEWGSARTQPDEWARAAAFVRGTDRLLYDAGMTGSLYNHNWFVIDTPQAELRLINEVGAKVIQPDLACVHAQFHKGVPDPNDWIRLAGMERLGAVHLANGLPTTPLQTVPIDEGQVDIAGLLAILWQRNFAGPLVLHGFGLGGDPYATAERSIQYVRSVWQRFQRHPDLNPYTARLA
jgi:sugar phosphate isomerase/epimerase